MLPRLYSLLAFKTDIHSEEIIELERLLHYILQCNDKVSLINIMRCKYRKFSRLRSFKIGTSKLKLKVLQLSTHTLRVAVHTISNHEFQKK